jgi:transcriptional regulator with XRE-family HTH domain
MAGLERNRFRTSESFREAARSTLAAHPEIGTLEQLAKELGISVRTLSRWLRKFGINKDELADWGARRLQARSVATTPTPNRWMFCLLITAFTLEEAIARFRDEINPSVEIESVQKIAGMSAGMTPA